jgi:predicted esterase
MPLLWSCLAVTSARADNSFDGEWRTSFGVVTLKQTNGDVTGSYGAGGEFILKGSAQGPALTFHYQEGNASGDAHWNLDESGQSFHGDFKLDNDGRTGTWNGWRPDPNAATGNLANLNGLWLTDLGLMELNQTGKKVKGRYAMQGGSEIEGKLTGRRFDFTFKSFRAGSGWFDVAADGKSFAGAGNANGFAPWFSWRGRPAPEFVHHVPLVAGKIVDGSTDGLLTYSIRAPDGFKAADAKKWPAILILHGSNMNGRVYVNTIATTWPQIARDYLLIGINGEMPSSIGDEPAFNYTYVDYVGRSTFKGFPGTDHESPALVAAAMDELRQAYPIEKYFVGGHSQGGFLTYSLLMNFPEKIAGAFPVSAGVIMQCEPAAFADEKLRAAQRAVPLAIIHSKQDAMVPFSAGEHAAKLFNDAGWPKMQFFIDDSGAGHRFALLPIDQAIHWLEAQQ